MSHSDQCLYFHITSLFTLSLTSFTVPSGTWWSQWDRLSQVAVHSAEYDSRERRPHPKCLKHTRVKLLSYIFELLDRGKSGFIWLHGTAGVGKSAVAFTVADGLKGLTAGTHSANETRLAGSFFFSREHTKRCTTGYFFPTLAYQLASNFPSVKKELECTIHENPALLDPDKSLREQMRALFLQPLMNLRFRLLKCPPLVFVLDALDECTSKTELSDVISMLGEALRTPDLPLIQILLTSRSEAHIRRALQDEAVRSLVFEIPIETSGCGTLSQLDGADVDNDIRIYLEYSFKQLQCRHPDFPRPSKDQLTQLVNRAGRRFIVASTMMKFIGDRDEDPRDRLKLVLNLSCNLLPGTEAYKLFDLILSTCTEPKRAFLLLSIVASLAYPLPISQISKLLGPRKGSDVGMVLMQLRSLVDIPSDSNLPVKISHLSIRDYVSNPSNCSFPEVQYLTPPHALLADSSLCSIMRDIRGCTTLLDALSKLQRHSHPLHSRKFQSLQQSLAFIIQPPEPLQALICLLWLLGDRSSKLQFWLETIDGHAWLQTEDGKGWLQIQGHAWLQTQGGQNWLQNQDGLNWLQTRGGRHWLQTHGMRDWFPTPIGQDWLGTQNGRDWLHTQDGRDWLQIQDGRKWLHTQGGRYWLQSQGGQDWLQTQGGRAWLDTQAGREWLQTRTSRVWLQTQGGREWLQTQDAQEWLQTNDGREWLQTQGGRMWLDADPGWAWLRTTRGREWLQTQPGRIWVQMQANTTQLQTQAKQMWQRELYQEAMKLSLSAAASRLNQSNDIRRRGEPNWLHSQGGREWLWTEDGQSWLQTPDGRDWQSTPSASILATLEEFSSTFEAIRKYIPESQQPAFQIIWQLKSLPDYLMFPVFLALRSQDHSTSASQSHLPPDMDIIRDMKAFVDLAQEAQERGRSTSDTLKYACQNWAFHLSRIPNPWGEEHTRLYTDFVDNHLLSWFERQWCLEGLSSCLAVLTEWQKHAKVRGLPMIFKTYAVIVHRRHESKTVDSIGSMSRCFTVVHHDSSTQRYLSHFYRPLAGCDDTYCHRIAFKLHENMVSEAQVYKHPTKTADV